MPAITTEQILGTIRTTLVSSGVALLAKYGVDTSTASGIVTPLVALVMAIGAFAWGLYSKRKDGLLKSAAAANPRTVIVTPSTVAKTTPGLPNLKSMDEATVVVK